MLTERLEYFVTVYPDGQLRLQTDRIIEDNGQEINRLHHSQMLEPDQDTTKFVPRAREIAEKLWTKQVKDDYTQTKAAREAEVAAAFKSQNSSK